MSAAPAIILLITNDAPADLIAAFCQGCEEEGVPVRVEPGEAAAAALAQQAAVRSELAVGAGIAGRTVVVHERSLASPWPALEALDADQPTSRMLGANAARLVKQRPLRLSAAITSASESEVARVR